jgi:serine/arginine repetitive matrix protein 2
MPPMDPRYKQYVAPVHPPFVAQGQRHVQRSVKGSASSGSTNMRTDSDTPSSDMAMPPTPTDGMSTNMLSSPPGIRMAKKTHATLVMGDKTPGSVDYYDGSEQWHNNEDVESEAERVPTGFVNQTKAVIEERAHSVAPGPAQPVASFEMSVVNRSSAVPTIAELPATPVGQRITRELVRKGLDPASTTGDATSTRSSPSKRDDMVVTDQTHDQTTVDRITDESSGASMLPTGLDNTHNSVLSQPSSNLANSSTIEFAVRYSIPAMTGSGPNGDRDARSEPPSTAPGSPDKSTDDGMSELLAGYQRTDTKQEDASVSAAGGTPKNKDLERASAHAHQSSDEQSFKSCTDVPISPESGKEAAGSPKPLQDILPDSQFPAKDSDARSFQTAKDVATPAHTISRPPSRLPSSGLDVEQQSNQPATDLSTPAQLRCKPVPPSHASIISSSSKLGGSSKPSIQQGSMAPMPGSLSTLGASQQPPVVPPRESSASAEAQRQNAVGSFLMRKVINPLRGSKGKKMAADEAASMKSNTDSAFSQPMQHSESMPAAVPPVPRPADVATAENVSTKQDVEPERKSSNLVESYSPTKDLSVGLTMVPAVHYPLFSSPFPGLPVPSSVYSPQDMSVHGRTYSSPTSVPKSPKDDHRDSHSTTHLSWAGRKPYGVPSASASEPRLGLPSVQEDTTTDLRLSVYRYNAPQRYLHDLKEDSHEDSSLDTSINNLKHSHFRFPPGAGFGMRTSVDDVIVVGGKSSAGSRRASAIDDVHGLPFLEFSEANLYDKFKNALPEGVRFSRSSAQAQLEGPDVVEQPWQSVGTEMGLMQVELPPVNGADQKEALRKSAESAGVIDLTKLLQRHYTSDRLIAEIDQVSIPSITGLTQRIVEIIPSLSLVGQREQEQSGNLVVEFPEEEEIMEHAIEEIHHVHPPTQKRSSARLRPIVGSPNLVVIDDDVFEEITSQERGGSSGDYCVWMEETEGGEVRARAKGKGKATTHTPTRQLSVVVELQTPSPVVLLPQTRTASHQVVRRSVESTFSSLTKAPSSFVSTPTAKDTRPWNSDKNYPWATTTNPAVDISLPPQAVHKQSPRPGPSHLRNALSDATSSTFTSLRTPTTSPSGNAARQAHRLSIFGRSGDQAHAVGERYPTSALSPPTAIFRDHLTTCDTSDDEDFTTSRKANKLTLRKRFSSAARSNTLSATTPHTTKSTANQAELTSSASVVDNSSSTLQDRTGEASAFPSNRHTFRDASGMPLHAYRRHRAQQAVIKLWEKGLVKGKELARKGVEKGKELARKMSRRQVRPVLERHDSFFE